jgi:hypothetical protein
MTLKQKLNEMLIFEDRICSSPTFTAAVPTSILV